jgi:serine/threonine protein kinase
MGTIFSSIQDCLNNIFSKSNTQTNPKNDFNIISLSDEKDIKNTKNINEKKIPLLEISSNEDSNKIMINNKNNLLSPKGYEGKEKDAFQAKEFKSKVTLNDFQVIKMLGKGAFGKVLLVYNEELKKYFAMKTLKKANIKKYQQTKHTKEERKILEKIDYPFISKLYYAFQNDKKLYMITEYMPGGEMFYHLHNNDHFSENKARFYIAEIVLAIDHLHKNNILYRDLKPENILLDELGHIKLTDFGLSKIMNNIEKDKTYTICGTPIYVAPEVLTGQGYNKLVDWWSLGVLLYEFLAGYSPYKEARVKIDIKIYKKKLEQDPLISDCAFDLIKKLCTFDVNKRIGKNVADIKNHSFFKDIDWIKLEKKEITPPYKPKIKYAGDVGNFDTMFTEMSLNSTKRNVETLVNGANTIKNSKNTYADFTYIGDKMKK